MQFPTIPSQKVAAVARRDVAGVAAAGTSDAGQSAIPGLFRAQPAAQPLQGGLPPAERRQGSRRAGPDRRRLQVPVMLDTRSGRDRRGERRRMDDPPPFRVNAAV